MFSLKDFLAAGTLNVSNLLFDSYAKLGLNAEEFLLWLELSRYRQKGIFFPEAADLGEAMGFSTEKIYLLLEKLTAKRAVKIDTKRTKQGISYDVFNLDPLYEKLEKLLQEEAQQPKKVSQSTLKRLLELFQSEFGRVLSPMEIETVQFWLQEGYSSELIRLALKEAVLNQAYSLKYIDRILISWEKKNLASAEEVEADQKKHQSYREKTQAQPEPKKVLPKISLVNLLEEEKGEKTK